MLPQARLNTSYSKLSTSSKRARSSSCPARRGRQTPAIAPILLRPGRCRQASQLAIACYLIAECTPKLRIAERAAGSYLSRRARDADLHQQLQSPDEHTRARRVGGEPRRRPCGDRGQCLGLATATRVVRALPFRGRAAAAEHWQPSAMALRRRRARWPRPLRRHGSRSRSAELPAGSPGGNVGGSRSPQLGGQGRRRSRDRRRTARLSFTSSRVGHREGILARPSRRAILPCSRRYHLRPLLRRTGRALAQRRASL